MNNALTVREAISKGLIQEGDVVEVKSSKTDKTMQKNVDFINTDNNTFEDAEGHSWGKGEFLRTINRAASDETEESVQHEDVPTTISDAISQGLISEGDTVTIKRNTHGDTTEREVASINEDKLTLKDTKGTVWGKSEFVSVETPSEDDSDSENDDRETCASASDYLMVGQTVEIESATSGKVFNRTVKSVDPGEGFTDEKDYFWDESYLISAGPVPSSNIASQNQTVGAADLRSKLKNSALPKEDRLLRENALEDDNGMPTMDARDYVLQVLTESKWSTLRTQVANLLEKELKSEEDESL